MEPDSITLLLIILLLLLLSAFFSSAETALTTVNKVRMRSLVEEGNKRASLVLRITDNSGKMLSAILIGNNIVNISTSALATIFTQNVFGNYAVSFATGILTCIILVFGEITPKTIATLYAEKIALAYAPVINLLMIIITPIIVLINGISYILLRLLHINPKKREQSITENELRTIVDVSHEEGVIENEERDMITNVFNFGDTSAKDIMVPRIDMSAVDIDCTYDELLSIFKQDRYTRIPVYNNSPENVVGIINMKDILFYTPNKEFHIKDYLREPYFTYEYKNLSELMHEMRSASVNLAIILDEYGAAVGLLTLEDLLEEIVGEIRDEYDEDEEDDVTPITDSEYVLDAQINLDDFNEDFNTHLESDSSDSLGGYLVEKLDRLAVVGDTIEIPGFKFVIDSIDKNRIDKVHVYIIKAEPETNEHS